MRSLSKSSRFYSQVETGKGWEKNVETYSTGYQDLLSNCLVEYSSETIWSCNFLSGRIWNYWVNAFSSYQTMQMFISEFYLFTHNAPMYWNTVYYMPWYSLHFPPVNFLMTVASVMVTFPFTFLIIGFAPCAFFLIILGRTSCVGFFKAPVYGFVDLHYYTIFYYFIFVNFLLLFYSLICKSFSTCFI